MNEENKLMVPDELIMSKIYLIRGQKVMMDRDLAELYGVETRRLKEQVKRNRSRFPEDFMFELTKEEMEEWRSNFGTSNREIMGLRIPPFAFTEHGVLMLASVLNSERAVQVNIQVVRIFTKMREMLLTHKDILIRLEQIENSISEHDDKIMLIFEYLKQFEKAKQEELEYKNRPRIGFKTSEKE
ncbi:MAG: ORF6N domain-containing protein [Bacteroidales bacterium]|nr:ORF6N domain-containing protein [Bacteroidales bacterium]